jgi:hypothetical protein
MGTELGAEAEACQNKCSTEYGEEAPSEAYEMGGVSTEAITFSNRILLTEELESLLQGITLDSFKAR